MFIIQFTPAIGYAGVVTDVDWKKRHFRYNPDEDPCNCAYEFDTAEKERFLDTFTGDFKVFAY